MSSPSTAARDALLRVVDRFPGRRIAVIGDLIGDEFLYGEIARVSREAPVLVLEYRELVRLPGGAANAACNLLDLGCRVRVAGAVGDDAAGRDLVASLGRKHADVAAVRRIRGYPTPVKTRILAGAHHSAPQQVVRVDRKALLEPARVPSERSIARAIRGCDAVILSDYGYGAVTREVAEAARAASRARAIPIVVDSRFRLLEFPGVTSLTPNITEVEAALGLSIANDARLLERAGRALVRRQRIDFLLVTQGRFGMTLLERGRRGLHIPIFGSDEVADVTGAGDTVIAVFTLALACGARPEEGARLANYAAGLVVMKRGTATVTRSELSRAIASDGP
jgi:rfaE bifunctional protein kinase chain/domain